MFPNLVELSFWTCEARPLLPNDTQWQAIMTALCGLERLQQLRVRNLFPLTLLELPDTLGETR
jgi:hypothetical protein